MSRSPNAEQLLAIEHQGGVLLRAGAGSGKTFVLVEHIVYLTKTWITSFQQRPQASFEEFIRQKFSQVVMMTFTKKAAGEMSIRLTEKFLEISEAAQENQDFWKIANDSLPVLMVTTIDGFCRKLMTAGYFPHLSTEAKVIFTPERKDQISELIDAWFEKRSLHISQDILEIIIREKEVLLSAFCNIFNDPGLRLSWKKFAIADSRPEKLGKVVRDSYQLNDISTLLGKIHTLDLPEESERSAFEKGMAEIQATGLPEVDSIEKLDLYYKYLSSKSFQPERTEKKKCEAYDQAHIARKALKDWVTTWMPEIELYIQNYDSKILPWMTLCEELFIWIDQGLDPNQGLTFGDIEYLVALGLENADDLARIQKTYSYFIVDEFQDTSALQFKIIQSLIGNDYQKLFCVGDAKQAIYGFRGGELSVFKDCALLVPQLRSLANNYRSKPEIIYFNNSLFSTVLPLGQGFEGHDAFSVDAEDQNVPEELSLSDSAGSIEILSAVLERDLEVEDKFKNEHINRIEASLLSDSILKERSLDPKNVCTILYSKLKPSMDLIRFLMEKKIGFTAQFKIDLLDDPILGIFLSLLRRQFDAIPTTKDRYPLFLIRSYLSVLNLPFEQTNKDLEAFDQNVRYWGLVEGFQKFLHGLGITNENSDINLKVIETISVIYHQDPEAIMVQIAKGDNDRISLDLRSGDNSHMVQIMTAHASKGLEFDIVYLSGIYTNGKETNDGALFGDMPGSFKWYLDLSQRDKRSSPFYLFENELSKYKNFSESKRLFYVACTRAKKKLVWVSLGLPEKSFSIPENSWIDGLNYWFNQGLNSKCAQSLQVTNVENFDSKKILLSDSRPQLPLFFHDSVGIFSKGPGTSELGLAAELSVTRLNSLVDCPRKFYFENILKLKGQESKPTYHEASAEEPEELGAVMKSSADRGTFIHAQIAEGIEKNFVVPRAIFSTEQHAPVEWALEQLRLLRDDFEMIAEKSLKFKFFNFMISGIPDLLLMPRSEQIAQIWDYKTGRITQENLAHYWVQLKVYAYALYELGRVPHSSEIILKLVFVDQKQTLELTISREQCLKDLFPLWRSQNEPWKTNPDHCAQCTYGDICPR
jgi:ATP-dependent exoDNAse (exonuclease V) beta subunit